MSTVQGYEVRYGFPGGYARLLFVCAAFVFGGLFVPLPAAVRLVELIVFGGGGLVLLVLGIRATVLAALRVDESGLTLGGAPTSYEPTTRHVPWSELRAVRLSRQREAPYLPVITAVRRGNREAFSKPLKGWRLDTDKLAQALNAFAPGVRLTDER
ncbi:hypothetical protein [Phytohabitans rumicis]|uniref:PH domain-containing protein n=1 Tax=Phytohabitans rumicis TaxID=1076125 RepID=A0A6V8LGL2_9ACTN|nr:hypothetical protein [Phytohabitans rumicis]GFJ93729.1 hypothetical protein Prum_073710 [Phytohabitans rumicis]